MTIHNSIKTITIISLLIVLVAFSNSSLAEKNINQSVSFIHNAIKSGDLEKVKKLVNSTNIDAVITEGASNYRMGMSFLMYAAEKNKIEIVKYLLQNGANVNYVNKNFGTALHYASGTADRDVISLLLNSGLKVNTPAKNTKTPLMIASEGGNFNIVEYLIQQGANINDLDEFNESALTYAVNDGNIKIIRLLVKKGADLNILDEDGTPLLHKAVLTDSSVVQELIRLGIDPDVKNADGFTALDEAISDDEVDSVRVLLEGGADLNVIPNDGLGYSLLIDAANKGNDEIVSLLIKHGAKVNYISPGGYTALSKAVSKQSVPTIRALIDGGADVNMKNSYGHSLLVDAITHYRRPDLSVVKVLVDSGVNIHSVDKQGKSLGHFLSSSRKNIEAIDLLVDLGLDINVFSLASYTPLMNASYNGDIKAVKWALSKGAKPNLTNKYGNSALHYAIKNNKFNVIDALLSHGADVSVINKKGQTALHYATTFGDEKSIKTLVDRGVDLNAVDEQGQTALTIAIDNNKKNVIAYLLSKKARSYGKRIIKLKDKIQETFVYKNAKLVEHIKYSTNNENTIQLKGIRDKSGVMKYEKYFSTLDKEGAPIVSEYWVERNGKKVGKYIFNNFGGKVSTEITFNSKGAVSIVDYHYDSKKVNLKGYYDSENNKTEVYKYSRKGKLIRHYFYQGRPTRMSQYRKKLGKLLFYSPVTGKVIAKEEYSLEGKLLYSNNNTKETLIKLLDGYLNNPKQGLYYFALAFENSIGYDTILAKKKLDAIVNEAMSKIIIKPQYTRHEAIRILETIGQVISNHGIIYDDKHINVISKTLVNEAMDCDIIAMLYLTIADKLKLPLYGAFYPMHMALIWKDSSNTIYWEATTHREKSIEVYQNWLGNHYNENLSAKNMLATPITKEESAYQLLSLFLSTTKSHTETLAVYNVLVERKAQLFMSKWHYSYSMGMGSTDKLTYINQFKSERVKRWGGLTNYFRADYANSLVWLIDDLVKYGEIADKETLYELALDELEPLYYQQYESEGYGIFGSIDIKYALLKAYEGLHKYPEAIRITKEQFEECQNNVCKTNVNKELASLRKKQDEYQQNLSK